MYEFLIVLFFGSAIVGVFLSLLQASSETEADILEILKTGLIEDVASIDVSDKGQILSLQRRAVRIMKEIREEE